MAECTLAEFMNISESNDEEDHDEPVEQAGQQRLYAVVGGSGSSQASLEAVVAYVLQHTGVMPIVHRMNSVEVSISFDDVVYWCEGCPSMPA